MASLPSAVSPSTFRLKPANVPLWHHAYTVSCGACPRISFKPTRKLVVAQYGMPDKAKMQMNAVKEQLWKSLPDSIKEFPWKKAEDQLLKRLLSAALEISKWAFVAWFVLSFLSDILYTMSRNQELLMPIGLLAGCFLSDFMKEVSDELFQQTQGKNWNLMGIGSVFVILKLMSVFLGIRGQIFFLHMGNGGLMQVLWLVWKQYQGDDIKNVVSE